MFPINPSRRMMIERKRIPVPSTSFWSLLGGIDLREAELFHPSSTACRTLKEASRMMVWPGAGRRASSPALSHSSTGIHVQSMCACVCVTWVKRRRTMECPVFTECYNTVAAKRGWAHPSPRNRTALMLSLLIMHLCLLAAFCMGCCSDLVTIFE